MHLGAYNLEILLTKTFDLNLIIRKQTNQNVGDFIEYRCGREIFQKISLKKQQDVTDLFIENYKILLKEIKVDLSGDIYIVMSQKAQFC